MQIVIDISEEEYAAILGNADIIRKRKKNTLEEAVLSGTPLPKGHGRLIDADIIKDFKNKLKDYKKDYKFTHEEIFNILERYEIKYAPTIIEADREE